jgi:hypothetical protein
MPKRGRISIITCKPVGNKKTKLKPDDPVPLKRRARLAARTNFDLQVLYRLRDLEASTREKPQSPEQQSRISKIRNSAATAYATFGGYCTFTKHYVPSTEHVNLFELATADMNGPQKRKLKAILHGCLTTFNTTMQWYYVNYAAIEMDGLYDYLRLENTAIPNIYDKTLKKFIMFEPFWREFTLRLVRSLILDPRMIVEILRGKLKITFQKTHQKF